MNLTLMGMSFLEISLPRTIFHHHHHRQNGDIVVRPNPQAWRFEGNEEGEKEETLKELRIKSIGL